MIPAWRISIHGDLNGLGGERGDGRWHTAAQGKRIVYLSEHPAVAVLESLVNLKGNPEFFPPTFQLLKIGISEDVPIAALPPGNCPTTGGKTSTRPVLWETPGWRKKNRRCWRCPPARLLNPRITF